MDHKLIQIKTQNKPNFFFSTNKPTTRMTTLLSANINMFHEFMQMEYSDEQERIDVETCLKTQGFEIMTYFDYYFFLAFCDANDVFDIGGSTASMGVSEVKRFFSMSCSIISKRNGRRYNVCVQHNLVIIAPEYLTSDEYVNRLVTEKNICKDTALCHLMSLSKHNSIHIYDFDDEELEQDLVKRHGWKVLKQHVPSSLPGAHIAHEDNYAVCLFPVFLENKGDREFLPDVLECEEMNNYLTTMNTSILHIRKYGFFRAFCKQFNAFDIHGMTVRVGTMSRFISLHCSVISKKDGRRYSLWIEDNYVTLDAEYMFDDENYERVMNQYNVNEDVAKKLIEAEFNASQIKTHHLKGIHRIKNAL